MAELRATPKMMKSDRPRRDSLFLRRTVGAAFVATLVLLGFAFPVMI
jgi:hypothetical protein